MSYDTPPPLVEIDSFENEHLVMRVNQTTDSRGAVNKMDRAVKDLKPLYITVNIDGLARLPDGFFGFMIDTALEGKEVRILGASKQVRAMLWYRMFVDPDGNMRSNANRCMDDSEVPPGSE